jgi:hypothetical protein
MTWRLYFVKGFLLLFATVSQRASSWTESRRFASRWIRLTPTQWMSSTADDVLGGVPEFNDWFGKLPGDKASMSNSVTHAAFGSLRGLEYIGNTTVVPFISAGTSILKLPRNVVLHTSFADKNWDSQLAQQLWKECLQGKQGKLSGYTSLLTRGCGVLPGSSKCPPSTAPNALRHWTEQQRSVLTVTPRGQQLLQRQKIQESEWNSKYTTVSGMSKDQFDWCMEVVHSRAFQGNFGMAPAKAIGSALAPMAAATIGWSHIRGNPDYSDLFLLGLAAVAVAPTIVSLVFPDKGDAVLLPVIDSANHLEDADSSIEYDPISQSFSLKIGPNCLLPDKEQTQLFVSYGKKTDMELLLNYGFLPGVLCSDGDDDISRDVQRQRLAEMFTLRSI